LGEPSRIACFHMNQVGDLLFSLPALYNLRAAFPEAHIASVARPHCKELLLLSGLVNEVIERPRRPIGSGLRVAARLRRRRFDLALIFSTSLGTAILALLSGSRARVGFAHSPAAPFLTQRVPWTPPPSTQNNLRLLEAIGCPVAKRDYVGLIKPGEPERHEADEILRSTGIAPGEQFAILGPGTSSSREIKCWSDEGFAQVADRLADEFGIKSVVVGLSGGNRIRALSGNAIDLTGKTSLPALAAVLERARIFVGVDSGVMHLAAAVGTPVVALFGPSDPRITGPQGEGHYLIRADLPCSPCLRSSCDQGVPCMSQIKPDEVIARVKPLIAGSPR